MKKKTTLQRSLRNKVMVPPSVRSSRSSRVLDKNAINNATDKVNSVADSIKDSITDTLDNIRDNVNIGANTISVLKADLGSLTASAKSAVKNALGEINKDTGKLADNLQAALKGDLEVKSQLKSLASDTSEALASPVSFISRLAKDVVEGVNEIPELINGAKDWVQDASKETIKNISDATGIDIKDASDMKNAIKETTKEISDGFKDIIETGKDVIETGKGIYESGKEIVNDAKESIGDVIESAHEIVDSVTGSIEDIQNAGYGIVDSVINGAQDITDGICDILPDKYGSWLKEKSDEWLSDAAESAKGSISGSIGKVIGKLTGGATDKENVISMLEKLYNNGLSNIGIIMGDGTSGYPTFGNASPELVKRLYEAAKEICPDISCPEYVDYDSNKDLIDMLLALAAQRGMVQLLKQLIDCLRRKDVEYLDVRTIRILNEILSSACMDGNPFSANTIIDAITAKQVRNLEDKLKQLGANMSDDPGVVSEYHKLCDSVGVKIGDLLSSNRNTPKSRVRTGDQDNVVYSGNDVVVMCATSTEVVDKTITMENRTLVQATMLKYAA